MKRKKAVLKGRCFSPSPRYAYLSLVVGLAIAVSITFSIGGLFILPSPLFDYAYPAHFLFFLLGVGLVYFWAKKTVYEVGRGGVRETKGAFFKKGNVVSFKDINNVRIERSLGDRIAGLGSVYIDTARSLDYEMVAKGLSVEDANEFVYLIERWMDATGKK